MEAFLLRLQARFPSTVSTVYRCETPPPRGEAGCEGVESPRPWPESWFLSPPPGPARSCSRPPGTASRPAPRGPAVCSVCALWTWTRLVCAATGGVLGGGGALVSARRGSACLCLQTVPQLLGHRPPHTSLQHSPPSQRPGRLTGPAAVHRWAGPRAAAGESPPCPVPLPTVGYTPARAPPHRAFSHREAARACVIEQLCYGCRVNLKDMVRGCPSPWRRGALAWLCGSAVPTPPLCVQPSLDPLPPYILAEAQLRSQRYGPLWGGRGGGLLGVRPHRVLPPGPARSRRPGRLCWGAMRRPRWARAEPPGRQEPAVGRVSRVYK